MTTLPLGFAEHVLELQYRVETEPSLEVIQILEQMYMIAVNYYINVDPKKAQYFQKKFNDLVVQNDALDSYNKIKSNDKKSAFDHEMANLIKDYSIREQSYLRCFVEKNERKTHKFMNYVKAEVDKQEELLKGRLLKRIKSQNQL